MENQPILPLRAPPQLEEGVASLRRADEDRPALPIGERRPDDLRPHPRVHVGVFVEHDAVEVDAAQRVGIVGAVEPDLPALGIIDAQLALVHGRAGRTCHRHRRAQVVPRHALGLAQERRQIGEARTHKRALHRAALQVMDAGHGLAGAAVGHDAGEALPPAMKGDELLSGPVVDQSCGSFHSSVTFRAPSSVVAPARSCRPCGRRFP